MSPAALIAIQLIAQYGPTFAQQIINLVNKDVTDGGQIKPETWDKLIAIENSSAAQFKAALLAKFPGLMVPPQT